MDLPPPFDGYRVAGNYLIGPGRQRITRERLDGLMWRDELELRRAGFASRRKAEAEQRAKQYGPRVKVVVIELSDYLHNGVAAG